MKVALVIVFLVQSFLLTAQFKRKDVDTIPDKESKTHFYTIDQYDLHQNLEKVDTHLNGMEVYLPAFQESYFPIRTGNFISASYDPFYINEGVNFGYNRYRGNILKKENLTFNSTHIPLTRISYAQSNPQQQYFKLRHHQSLTQLWQLGLFYDRAATDGMFSNQEGELTNYAIQFRKNSLDQRSTLIFGFIRNNLVVRENGGIQNIGAPDSLGNAFTFNLTPFIDDSRMQRRELEGFVNYYKDFGGAPYSIALNDSDYYCISEPQFRYFQKVSGSSTFNSYEDNGMHSGQQLYDTSFYNASVTMDSFYFNKIENQVGIQQWHSKTEVETYEDSLGWHAKEKVKEVWWYSLSSRQAFYNTGSYYINNYYDDFYYLDGELLARFKAFNLKYRQVLFGRFFGDYNLDLNLDLSKADYRLKVGGYLGRNGVSILANRFDGNHIRWNNDFGAVSTQKGYLQFELPNKDLKVQAESRWVIGYQYFDSTGMAQQAPTDVWLNMLRINKQFNFGIFHLRQVLHLNYALQQEDYMRLPLWNSFTSLYMDTRIFKGNLWFQLGIEQRWSQKYYGYAYSPQTGQFHVQNDYFVEGMPRYNAFFNWKVQRARFFIRLDNIWAWPEGQNFPSQYYHFNVANHPLFHEEFMLRFGVKWKFYY